MQDPLDLEAGQSDTELKINLDDGDQSFEGWVSYEDGTPVPNYPVHLSSMGNGASGSVDTLTDKNGRFRLVPSGIYSWFSFCIYISDTDKYRTGKWGEKDIHFVIKKNTEFGSINGVVLDENGQPLTIYDINLLPSKNKEENNNKWTYSFQKVVNPDGYFEFNNISISQCPFLLQAKKNGVSAFSEVIFLQKDEILDNIILKMPQTFTITGKILYPNNIIAAGADISFYNKIPEGLNLDIFDLGEFYSVNTDKNGFFSISNIPLRGGTIYIWISRDQNQNNLNSMDPDTVEDKSIFNDQLSLHFSIDPGQPGEQRDLGKIILKPNQN